jgi:hypothetical protein
MNTKSQQAEQAEQTHEVPEVRPNRATRQHVGRTAMAIVTVAIGAALTALVIGVAGGTDTKPPPSPGVPPSSGIEVPPEGFDPQLHKLAQERLAVPPEGFDPQLYKLAQERNAVPPEGFDPQLYKLAEQWAERQAARQD